LNALVSFGFVRFDEFYVFPASVRKKRASTLTKGLAERKGLPFKRQSYKSKFVSKDYFGIDERKKLNVEKAMKETLYLKRLILYLKSLILYFIRPN
jgi:hypothetical protein